MPSGNAQQPLLGGIEGGGTKFVAAVARKGGPLLERVRIATRRPEETLPEVAAFFAVAQARHGSLAAMGIGSFGPLELDRDAPGGGGIAATPKPGWAGLRYSDWLDLGHLPVMLDTDVVAAALAEFAGPAGTGCGTLAYTTVGTGIGTGVIRGGVPLGGFAPLEAGHTLIPREPGDAFAGSCRVHGACAEGMASGTAIRERFGKPLDELDDPAAAITLIAGYLGSYAANLIFTHAPDRLVFGGGVMKTPGLIEAVRSETERRLAGYVSGGPLDPGLKGYLVAPAMGDDAGVSGAIELAAMALARTEMSA